MSEEKLQPITLLSNRTKSCQDNSLTKEDLFEAQLEAITDGLMKLTTLYTSFRDELMSEKKLDGLTATTTSDNPVKNNNIRQSR